MINVRAGVFVQNLYHGPNLSSNTLIFWSTLLSWLCSTIQHIVDYTQSLFEVLIHKGPNEVIKTRLLALKAAIYPKLLLIANSSAVHASFTNLLDEFKNTVCHHIKGICGLLNLGFSKQAVKDELNFYLFSGKWVNKIKTVPRLNIIILMSKFCISKVYSIASMTIVLVEQGDTPVTVIIPF